MSLGKRQWMLMLNAEVCGVKRTFSSELLTRVQPYLGARDELTRSVPARTITGMEKQKQQTVEVICPCCGARLDVDMQLGKVLFHEPPPKPAKAPDLDRASQLLKEEAERRESLFKQSAEDEKMKSELLERRFREAIEKTKDQPTGPPLKEIDLD